jgi:hypothetical protein
MDEVRSRKIGRNESGFREINESINDLVQRGDPLEGEQIAIVCECGNENCSTLIYLFLEEYEHLRAGAARFGVLPGHEIPGAERIVEDKERYYVVEKFGGAQAEAESSDPRS